jgi:sugar lactone lactonase YvrE
MPTLIRTSPSAVMPGGELWLEGEGLGPGLSVTIGGVPAPVELARVGRALVRIPAGVLPGEIVAFRDETASNGLHVEVAVAMAENLHPVANPAVDAHGTVYATLSGSRGQETPVSIFRIPPAPEGQTHELRPFVRGILNPTGLAFGPNGDLYVSSRAEGTIYRVNAEGDAQTFAEGLGIATGIAFDQDGDLYVGDRSGTIFKIRMAASGRPQETFVFATLEPSIAAYHLAFDQQGVLYVTGPTTASNQAIHAIDRDGTLRVFHRGLGRAQGMAFDVEGNLYVAASLAGDRGIVRITPRGAAELVVSGSNLVGLCFLPDGRVALAQRNAVYELHLGVEGRRLS